MVFWYLSILLSMTHDHYAELRVQLDMDRRMYSQSRKNKGTVKPQSQPPTKEQRLIALLRTVVSGLSMVCFVLEKSGILPRPTFPLGSDELRYDLRFAAFKSVNFPQFISYDKYAEQYARLSVCARDADTQAPVLAQEAVRSFERAAELLKELRLDDPHHDLVPQELHDRLYRVVMSDLLTAKLLARGVPKGAKASFRFDTVAFLPVVAVRG